MISPDAFMGLTFFAIIKWFLLAGLVMYLAFAGIIVRQVGVMSETLEDPMNPLIKLFAWTHFILTIVLILLVWVLL
jgi:hypothetical protein